MLESVTGVSVDTVSFHVPPEWVLRRSFDGFVSTYEERFLERSLTEATRTSGGGRIRRSTLVSPKRYRFSFIRDCGEKTTSCLRTVCAGQ